eukprot:tig00000042_g15569.t1
MSASSSRNTGVPRALTLPVWTVWQLTRAAHARTLRPNRWSRGLKGADIFEFSPEYRYVGVKTRVGACFSLVCIVCLLAFVGWTLNDFIKGLPQKTTAFLNMPADRTVPIDAQAKLALGAEGESGDPFLDPTLFSVTFTEVTETGPLRANRPLTRRDFGIAPCRRAGRTRAGGQPPRAPHPVPPVPHKQPRTQGQPKDLVYRYIRVSVALCRGEDFCQKVSEAAAAAERLMFSVWLYSQDFDFESARTISRPYYRRYFANPGAASLVDFLVAGRRVSFSARIYFDGDDYRYPFSTIEELGMSQRTSACEPGMEVLTITVRANDQYPRDEYRPYSLPRMVADWGALWAAVSLSLGWLARRFNAWVFRRAGRHADFGTLIALDLKSAAHSNPLSRRAQTPGHVASKMLRLRREIAAEVRDEQGQNFDYGQSFIDTVQYLVDSITPDIEASSFTPAADSKLRRAASVLVPEPLQFWKPRRGSLAGSITGVESPVPARARAQAARPAAPAKPKQAEQPSILDRRAVGGASPARRTIHVDVPSGCAFGRGLRHAAVLRGAGRGRQGSAGPGAAEAEAAAAGAGAGRRRGRGRGREGGGRRRGSAQTGTAAAASAARGALLRRGRHRPPAPAPAPARLDRDAGLAPRRGEGAGGRPARRGGPGPGAGAAAAPARYHPAAPFAKARM